MDFNYKKTIASDALKAALHAEIMNVTHAFQGIF